MFGPYEHQGGEMAIFSKKQSAKSSNDQAKVILDGSLQATPEENPPVKESTAAHAEVREPDVSPSVAAEPAAPQPVADVPSAPHEIEPEPIETPPVVPLEHRFGIDDAILLMRSLPTDSNMALVVRVVRVTLGAVHVSVEEIVADAVRKEAHIKESIVKLEGQVGELEKQLAIIRGEITAQQADLKETINVRERLHMADQYPASKPPPTPTAATGLRASLSKPFTS
jgi:hypothetical protein